MTITCRPGCACLHRPSSSVSNTLLGLAAVAVLRWLAVGHERKRHRCLRRRDGAAVELVAALTVLGFHLQGEIASFRRPVTWVPWALWDVAHLDLVLLVGILSVAPWLLLAGVRVAAVVVIAKAIAPLHEVFGLLVRFCRDLGGLLP